MSVYRSVFGGELSERVSKALDALGLIVLIGLPVLAALVYALGRHLTGKDIDPAE